jgi:hypothetical protein
LSQWGYHRGNTEHFGAPENDRFADLEWLRHPAAMQLIRRQFSNESADSGH